MGALQSERAGEQADAARHRSDDSGHAESTRARHG
jgi:hypothetical protein